MRAAFERRAPDPVNARTLAGKLVHAWKLALQTTTRKAAESRRRGPAIFLASLGDRGADDSLLRRHREGRFAINEVEAVEVHHLGPRLGEVLHELFSPVGRPINLRERPELRV